MADKPGTPKRKKASTSRKRTSRRRPPKPPQTQAEKLEREIFLQNRHHVQEHHSHDSAWHALPPGGISDVRRYATGYMRALAHKHHRLRADYLCNELERAGYVEMDLETALTADMESLGNRKKFYARRGLMVFGIQVGLKGIEEGMHIVAAHIDSPCLRATDHPLRQNYNQAGIQCMHYGGIKSNDFMNIPLAMYIHAALRNREGKLEERHIIIGDDNGEPHFFAPSAAFHYTNEEAEMDALRVLIGNRPYNDKGFNPKKTVILQAMNGLRRTTQTQITERDIEDADIWFFPAGQARFADLDKSIIAAPGQDNMATAYALLRGFIGTTRPEYTKLAIWYSGEEVGDAGAGSLRQNTFSDVVTPAITFLRGKESGHEHKGLRNGWSLFLDVTAPGSPSQMGLHDVKDCAYMGAGPVLVYSGGDTGAYGGYDSDPVFRSMFRRVLDDNDIPHHVAMMGSQEERIANASDIFHTTLGTRGIDAAISILGMHRGIEHVAAIDAYYLERLVRAFYGVKNHAKYEIPLK